VPNFAFDAYSYLTTPSAPADWKTQQQLGWPASRIVFRRAASPDLAAPAGRPTAQPPGNQSAPIAAPDKAAPAGYPSQTACPEKAFHACCPWERLARAACPGREAGGPGPCLGREVGGPGPSPPAPRQANLEARRLDPVAINKS
jgi:hypothetical protein